MSKMLVLGLEGLLQSYGTDSKYYVRDTDLHPSKSAIVGMVLCALGDKNPSGELLGALSSGYMEVESYRAPWGRVMTDFHMMGSGHDTSEWDKCFQLQAEQKTLSPTKMSWRRYLTGYKFKVILELEEGELADKVTLALQNPVGSIVLGRRACPPSAPVFRTVTNSLEEARALALFGDSYRKVAVVKEGSHPEEGEPNFVNDIPVRMGTHKEYCGRHLTTVRL